MSLTNHWGQDKEIHEGNKRVCVGGKPVVVRWGLGGGGVLQEMIILTNSGKMKKLLGEGEGTQRPRDTALGAQKERGREGSQ